MKSVRGQKNIIVLLYIFLDFRPRMSIIAKQSFKRRLRSFTTKYSTRFKNVPLLNMRVVLENCASLDQIAGRLRRRRVCYVYYV